MDPSKKNIYLIAGIALVVLLAAIYFLFVFPSRAKNSKNNDTPTEVKSASEIDITKRPYVTLTPTSNGAEIVMSMENMQEFDSIEYELTYLSDNPQISGEKIERGSTGNDVNTKEEKYKKSMLLGTASRGVSNPDTGIEQGKLTLHMIKNNIEYKSETNWDLLKVGLKAQKISSRDGTLTFDLPSFSKDYWVIIADTVGIPPKGDFDKTQTTTPIIGTFSVAPKFQKEATITIKSDSVTNTSEFYSYNVTDSAWHKRTAKINETDKTISSTIDNFATFVILSPK